MVLSRVIVFVRWEVSEEWKRLKVKSVGKTIPGAKIILERNQCTNEPCILILF